MKLIFSERAWSQYLEWQGDDGRTLVKINELIRDCMRDPFRGIGKPEPLSGNLSGWWSRRITGEHRLVYRVSGSGEAKAVEVAQCRYHY
ncbi:Txe/YoeB family addiction module toxin [Sphingomonas aerophila]|uniref:Putative mRNA interferase YoeB n=1 Tax=Sphingomonas aerophila TaxID=1344948 RepID=A0A7W9ESX4_9SPHN|nr:toxin YoeB [Sphingomonas aerophila]